MPLSTDADALAYVRAMTGDTDSNDYYLTDDELDYIYDNKASSDIDKTIAFALRQMCAKAFRKITRSNSSTGETLQAQQERDHLCEQAEYWEQVTGILGGAVSTGTINLGIYEEDSDFDIT